MATVDSLLRGRLDFSFSPGRGMDRAPSRDEIRTRQVQLQVCLRDADADCQLNILLAEKKRES